MNSEIYYKESADITREADKSWELPGELASWRPRSTASLVVAWVQRLKNQKSWWCHSRRKMGKLNTQEELMFLFESKGEKKANVPVQSQSGKKNSLLGGKGAPTCSFYSGLQQIGWGPPTFKRAICFSQSANLNMDLIPKQPHRNIHNKMFDRLSGHAMANQVDTQNEPSGFLGGHHICQGLTRETQPVRDTY